MHSMLVAIFFGVSILWGIADAKGRNEKKSELSPTLNQGACPKLALLLYEKRTDKNEDNFNRQIPQTLTLLKSVVVTLEQDDCVHVILVSNKRLHLQKIQSEVRKWDAAYRGRLYLEFVPLKYPPGRKWMRDLHRSGSTFGIFLPDILPYDSVIYTDTDVLFLRSIRDLWSEMSKLGPSALASAAIRTMPLWAIDFPCVHEQGIGAGVMLMNLTRMRERRWSQKVVTKTVPHVGKIKFGFEDFLNVYFHDFPAELGLLSCDWNYWYHRCMIPCEDEENGIKGGISILHGNELTFMDEAKEPMYRSVYKSFETTDLTSNFDLGDLIGRIKSGMDIQRPKQETYCSMDTTFEDLVLKRLLQKLGRS